MPGENGSKASKTKQAQPAEASSSKHTAPKPATSSDYDLWANIADPIYQRFLAEERNTIKARAEAEVFARGVFLASEKLAEIAVKLDTLKHTEGLMKRVASTKPEEGLAKRAVLKQQCFDNMKNLEPGAQDLLKDVYARMMKTQAEVMARAHEKAEAFRQSDSIRRAEASSRAMISTQVYLELYLKNEAKNAVLEKQVDENEGPYLPDAMTEPRNSPRLEPFPRLEDLEMPATTTAQDIYVRGVQISYSSIEIYHGTPRYTAYESLQINMRGDLPNLSERIELPLVCYQGNYDNTNRKFANWSAEQLFRGEYTTNLENIDDWGNLPLRIRNPGAMLVFRQDGRELLPQHVEALVVWIPTVFAGQHFGAARKAMEKGRKEAEMKVFEQRATRKNFEAFWGYWKGLDARYEALKSPYEM